MKYRHLTKTALSSEHRRHNKKTGANQPVGQSRDNPPKRKKQKRQQFAFSPKNPHKETCPTLQKKQQKQNRLDFVDLHFQAADVLRQPENAENRPKTARRLCCAKDATGKLRWGLVRRLSPPHRGYAPIEKIRPTTACPRTQTRYPYARHCVSAGRMLPATIDTSSPKRLCFGRLLRGPSC